jgi:hypothetical protein
MNMLQYLHQYCFLDTQYLFISRAPCVQDWTYSVMSVPQTRQ